MIDVGKLEGLSEEEAALRLREEGPNELPSADARGIWRIARSIVAEPMIALLIGCGAVYLVLGDLREALILLISIVGIVAISFLQERKAENAIEALKNLASPRALVIRNGIQRRIPGREVVRGDLVVLSEGDRVPADGVVIWSTHLTADESLLTGESVPVRKTTGEATSRAGRPGGDDTPFVYSGSLVVGGQAVAKVLDTGIGTEMGKIGKSLQTIGSERTHLQKETGRIVRVMAVGGALVCLSIFLVYWKTRGDWVGGALAGLTTAMSLLPEEFPVVLTLFLAVGAWRISRRNVLTRRMAALENLGATTVLCVDKTGTLTWNRMAVAALDPGDEPLRVSPGEGRDLPEAYHRTVEYGVLASHRDPFDPMEKAILKFAHEHLAGTEHIHDDWELVREYPLRPELLAMSCVWRERKGEGYQIGAKGAPEAVMDLCHLDPETTAFWTKRVQDLANRGLRVLGVAHAVFQRPALPQDHHDFAFRFIGLIALQDPVRPDVKESVAECGGAGMRVLMMTGDYPATARNIAAEIGLPNADSVVAGTELESLSPEDLEGRLAGAGVFARVVPEQKLTIVRTLKEMGEVVAMTGDGVNDGPSLKAADVGVAMGGRGTDVAREAADIVLLDDDFSSIVAAIRLGRRIYDNIKKAMSYLLAIHVPIAALALLPVLLGQPLALYPVHIVFLELVIDPSCSLVFETEPEEKDVMSRPPRKKDEPMFRRGPLLLHLLQGLLCGAAVMAIYGIALHSGASEGTARAQAFIALITANLGLIFINRSWKRGFWESLTAKNVVMLWVTVGALGALAASVWLAPVREIFRFDPVPLADQFLAVAVGFGSTFVWEAVKAFRPSQRPIKRTV